MQSELIPTEAQNKLEFDLMQCDSIDKYFAHLHDKKTRLLPDAVALKGLIERPVVFLLFDHDGTATKYFNEGMSILNKLPFSLKNNRNRFVDIKYRNSIDVTINDIVLNNLINRCVVLDFDIIGWLNVNLFNARREDLVQDIAQYLEARDLGQKLDRELEPVYKHDAETFNMSNEPLNYFDKQAGNIREHIKEKANEAINSLSDNNDLDGISLDDASDMDDLNALNDKDSDDLKDLNAELPNNNDNQSADDSSNNTEPSDDNKSSDDAKLSESQNDVVSEPDDTTNTASDAESHDDPNVKPNEDANTAPANDTSSVNDQENEAAAAKPDENTDTSEATTDETESVKANTTNEAQAENAKSEEEVLSETVPTKENTTIKEQTSATDTSGSKDTPAEESASAADIEKGTAKENTADDKALPATKPAEAVHNMTDNEAADDLVKAALKTAGKSDAAANTDIQDGGVAKTEPAQTGSLVDNASQSKSEQNKTTTATSQVAKPEDTANDVPIITPMPIHNTDDELKQTLIRTLNRVGNKPKPVTSPEQEEFYRTLISKLNDVSKARDLDLSNQSRDLQVKLIDAINSFVELTKKRDEQAREREEQDRLRREAAERKAQEEEQRQLEEQRRAEKAEQDSSKTERQKFTENQDEIISDILEKNLGISLND